MNGSGFRTALMLASAALLASCGGGSGSGNTAVPVFSLAGTWYSDVRDPRDTGSAAFITQAVIRESGSQVLITYCDRTTETIARSGNELLNLDGTPYPLAIQDATTLVMRPGIGPGTVPAPHIWKHSDSLRFDSGSASFTFPSGETLASDSDVCAKVEHWRFSNLGGRELTAPVVTVTAPYRDSWVRIVIAFREIADGRYDIVGYEPFFADTTGLATLQDLSSPLFAAQYGAEALIFKSGTVQVSNYTGSAVELAGSVVLGGGTVRFTARVTLWPRG
jgi:hypothetical protein